jgi:hypothetical protein
MSDHPDRTEPVADLPEDPAESADPAGGIRFPSLNTWVLRASLLAGAAITFSVAYGGPPTSSVV